MILPLHSGEHESYCTVVPFDLSVKVLHILFKSRLTIVSHEAKKKQAVHNKRVSYLHVAPL